MALGFTFGDEHIAIDDLPESAFLEAASKHPETTWLRLYAAPELHPEALYELVCSAAELLGAPAPKRPTHIEDAVEFLHEVDGA